MNEAREPCHGAAGDAVRDERQEHRDQQRLQTDAESGPLTRHPPSSQTLTMWARSTSRRVKRASSVVPAASRAGRLAATTPSAASRFRNAFDDLANNLALPLGQVRDEERLVLAAFPARGHRFAGPILERAQMR